MPLILRRASPLPPDSKKIAPATAIPPSPRRRTRTRTPPLSGHTATLLSTVALQQDAMMSGSWSPYFVQLLFRRGRPSGRP